MVIGAAHDAWWLPRERLDGLIQLLRDDGRRVIGPTVRDGAIVLAEISGVADLPTGVGDIQAPGRYELTSSGDRTFDFASSPTSWKAWTFPSTVPVSKGHQDGDRVAFDELAADTTSVAFLGARACDLAALRIHDTVLTGGPFVDTDYRARRNAALVVAVECATPSGTCFCSSMGTGPEVTSGFDLALTELEDGFVVRTGSAEGRELVGRLGVGPADETTRKAAAEVPAAARERMGTPLEVDGLAGRLLGSLEHPRWEQVAERCLACTNCTLVCPTCFCISVQQTSDLLTGASIAERRWDSCFNPGFASVAGGGNFRSRRQDRYRQWLTHKFGTWVEQFGSSGCVGCGRCITWCPVGIDVREELLAIAPPEADGERVAPESPAPVAAQAGRYAIGVVQAKRAETRDTWTLRIGELPAPVLAGTPGQFLMLDLPGFSAVPISVSRYAGDGVDLTIRAAGATTRALTDLAIGAQVGLRGPLGRGWPIDAARGRDVIIVAGGIGLAPLRPVIDEVLGHRERYGDVRIEIGARTPSDLLFADEIRAWQERQDATVEVTVDRGDDAWTGPVGVVTQLFDRAPIDGPRSTAFVCGPEKMMQASARTLAGRGLLPERVLLSMERHMECGIGLCGHCQLGPLFVCRDGPVFTRAELGETFELEGV